MKWKWLSQCRIVQLVTVDLVSLGKVTLIVAEVGVVHCVEVEHGVTGLVDVDHPYMDLFLPSISMDVKPHSLIVGRLLDQ